jgi:geranyl-CoA carboxylase alpha subunit
MSPATPFSKILVANRGEIALRIIRTAHAMGYGTVAVCSEADADAPHVRAADQAVAIGASAPSQSYLNIEALIAAARASGADAVHPGYGFLAENEAFAAACAEAGLVFIGPSAGAIRAMGDKAAAKRLMIAAGVPCIPGFQSEDPADQSEERLAAAAARIGFPVMIKATAGGGGRGMRRVPSPQGFAEALRSARSEALHAFGDATVLLERAIDAPRHVEIQVFADRHGHVVHLGERDCSVQRRHQKLVEESPSPAVDAALRQQMGATAVAAARAIAYEGAGTLEFLLDAQGRYYFMEMNTRLQVEHAVTEALTGLDLVEWQIRVAAGEPLPLQQDDIRLEGHAIEVRLCAEDAAAGFLPCSGVLRRWHPAPGVRVDHALRDGVAVPPFYDSMIAKLVAHGRTREDARRRLARALRATVALGVTTNQDFLARCLEHPVFAAGGATTDFIARHEAQLHSRDDGAQRRALAVAAWLMQATDGGERGVEDTLAQRWPVGMRLALDGQPAAVRLTRRGPRLFEAEVDSVSHTIEAVSIGDGEARCALDGVIEGFSFARDGSLMWLGHRGRQYGIEDHTRAPALRRSDDRADGRVLATMNGRVVSVLVAVGERVQAGSAVLVLEAMKMEHVHSAPVSGTVGALHVGAGEQVAARRIVVEIVPDGADARPS